MTTTSEDTTDPEYYTSVGLLISALSQLILVAVGYRIEKNQSQPPLVLISTSTWAIGLGILSGSLLTFISKSQTHHAGLDPQVLFYGLLPPIILEAGFNTQRIGFFSNFWTILLLAVGGTIIATCVTGGLITWLGQLGVITPLSLDEALLYGSLVSAVDPVATLVVLKKCRAPSLLLNLVFGESVLNDAISIALSMLFQSVVQRGKPDITLGSTLSLGLELSYIFIGSIVLAGLVSFSSAYCLHHSDEALKRHPTYEIAIILISTYASYVAADLCEFSGLLAVFFSGVFVRHYHMHTISPASAFAFKHLLETLAFLAENFIYLYLGISVVSYENIFAWDWRFVAVSCCVCLLARAVNIFPLCALANCFRGEDIHKIPTRYMVVVWFSGLRGAIAFALALTVTTPNDSNHAAILKSSTLFTVLFTTVVFGTGTSPLLSVLKLRGSEIHTAIDAESLIEKEEKDDEHQMLLYANTTNNQPWHHTWSVHDAWIALDEKYLKPLFGGNPRQNGKKEESMTNPLLQYSYT